MSVRFHTGVARRTTGRSLTPDGDEAEDCQEAYAIRARPSRLRSNRTPAIVALLGQTMDRSRERISRGRTVARPRPLAGSQIEASCLLDVSGRRRVEADTHAMANPSTSYVSGERCVGS